MLWDESDVQNVIFWNTLHSAVQQNQILNEKQNGTKTCCKHNFNLIRI